MLVTCNLCNATIKILIVNIKLIIENQNANPKLHTINVYYTLWNIVQNWNTKCNCTQILHLYPYGSKLHAPMSPNSSGCLLPAKTT